MARRHSFRKAHISAAVGSAVLVVGFVTFGRNASDVAYQLLVLAAFASCFATLLWLYRREDRLRDVPPVRPAPTRAAPADMQLEERIFELLGTSMSAPQIAAALGMDLDDVAPLILKVVDERGTPAIASLRRQIDTLTEIRVASN